MPYSISNPPKFAKNYTDAEKKVASEAANRVLNRGGTEEEAIFAGIAAVKNYRKQHKASHSVSKALERRTPMHLQAILQKAVVEPPEASEDVSDDKPKIRKEFLGKNALETGVERNLVSVVLADNLNLVHTFDTGEQILTDLSKIQGVIENYVHITNEQKTNDGTPINGKFTIRVNTISNQPLLISHNLGLIDPDAFLINFVLNGSVVSVDTFAVDGNTIEITTFVDTLDLKVSIISAE